MAGVITPSNPLFLFTYYYTKYPLKKEGNELLHLKSIPNGIVASSKKVSENYLKIEILSLYLKIESSSLNIGGGKDAGNEAQKSSNKRGSG